MPPFLPWDPTQRNCKILKLRHRKAERWAQQHGSQFAPSKNELIHFPRDLCADTSHLLRLPQATIEASLSCRYLGIETDPQLRLDYHREKLEGKATKRLLNLSALASSTRGTGLISLRQVYRAMFVPQKLYGCSAWHDPEARGRGNGSAIINTITRIQRRRA